MEDRKRVANRVLQLEAQNLDHEFTNILDESVESLGLPVLNEELKLILKLYTSASLLGAGKTIGMDVYRMRYYDNSFKAKALELAENVGGYKMLLLTGSNLVLPYVLKKYAKLDHMIRDRVSKHLNLEWLTLDNVTLVVRLLSIVNFLEFLRSGKHLTLQERILNVIPRVGEQDHFRGISMNKVQMELLHRETIWRALAEFITTVIPFVNTTRIKNQVMRFTGLMPKLSEEKSLAEKIMTDSNSGKCSICNKQPFNPYMIGCRHVFCYYCLYSKYLSDHTDGFVCLLCNYNTKDLTQVHRYRAYELSRLTE